MYNALPIPLLEVNDGWGYYIGQNIQTKVHAHHAVEIVLALDKPFSIHTAKGTSLESKFSIIAANIPHSFLGHDAIYLFIYLDPQLSFAKELNASLQASQQDILQSESSCIAATRKALHNLLECGVSEAITVNKIVLDFLTCLCPYISEENKSDSRVAQATNLIQSSLHQEISLNKIAAQVYLSPSRFSHLFCEHTGIPFRRYILWCRIQVSLKAVMTGQSLTQAAYEGGFSDGAHLSRTFTEMFGVSPSGVLK